MKKIIFVLLLIWPSQILAHRIGLFAYIEGKEIKGQVYFIDGSPAKKAQVKLINSQGKVIGLTKTDEKGNFSFTKPSLNGILRIVAIAEAGHRSEMTLKIKDKTIDKNEKILLKNNSSSLSKTTTISEQEIAHLVQNVVQKELQPIRELLEEVLKETKKPSLQEIIGGLGYIVGLFGLIFWIKAKR